MIGDGVFAEGSEGSYCHSTEKRLILGKFVGLLCFLKAKSLERWNDHFFLHPETKLCLFWTQKEWRPKPASGVEGLGPGHLVAGLE